MGWQSWLQLRLAECLGHAIEDIPNFSVHRRESAEEKDSLKAHECLHLCKTQKQSVPCCCFFALPVADRQGHRLCACDTTTGAPCRFGGEWAASEGTAAEARAFHSDNTYKPRGTEQTSDMSCAGET